MVLSLRANHAETNMVEVTFHEPNVGSWTKKLVAPAEEALPGTLHHTEERKFFFATCWSKST